MDGVTPFLPSPVLTQSPVEPDDDAGAMSFAAQLDKTDKKPLTEGPAVAHAALYAAELVPGGGHIAAVANSLLYLVEGHKREAAMSAAAAVIPGQDQLTGTVGLLKAGTDLAHGGYTMEQAHRDNQKSAGG